MSPASVLASAIAISNINTKFSLIYKKKYTDTKRKNGEIN